MQIPIQNIYFLLCYAWNRLDEKDRVAVAIDDKTELLDLFAKILINAAKVLLKRGIDMSYLPLTSEHPGVKGKLELSGTLKGGLYLKQRTICTFDEFSPNTLPNRILITTLIKLAKTRGLDKGLKSEIRKLLDLFPEIEPIQIRNAHFTRIRLNRNNKFYGFILDVCRLIFENTLPSENAGEWEFMDFTRDESKMNKLFEAFVRNFCKIEQNKYKVRREDISWSFVTTAAHLPFLPQMETDITLENEQAKIIIDAKFYRETMNVHYEKERIKSGNLYQIFSYLINQRDKSERSHAATGILLYPTISAEYNLDYQFEGHKVLIRTVDLNDRWDRIGERLRSIIGDGEKPV